MSTWNDRIRERREAEGIPKGEFARQVKVSAPTVTDWESGKIRRIDGENLIRVCDVLKVSPKWLLTGRPPRNYIDGEVIVNSLPPPVPPSGSRVLAWETLSDLPDSGLYVTVPHFDVRLSAGDGASAEWMDHPANEPMVLPLRLFQSRGVRPEDVRGLYVAGSSMEPTLLDGDTVLIDTSRTEVQDDAIFAVLYQGELYIKRLFRLPGGVELRSDNPRHPSPQARGPDLASLLILGRMIWRAG